MFKRIGYVGLGIRSGQQLAGPELAPQYFLEFLSRSSFIRSLKPEIVFNSVFDLHESEQGLPVFSRQDIQSVQIEKYHFGHDLVRQSLLENDFTVNVGGDHSVALSTVSAFLNQYPDGQVIWIDAHADINIPEKSQSGNLHGMPLAFLMNLAGLAGQKLPYLKNFLNPSSLTYIGLRDIDHFEVDVIRNLKIPNYSAHDVKRLGVHSILETLDPKRPIHISIDVDGLDPSEAPSTGLQVPGGLKLDEVSEIVRWASQSRLKSLDIVEINPEVGCEVEIHKTFESAEILFRHAIGAHANTASQNKCEIKPYGTQHSLNGGLNASNFTESTTFDTTTFERCSSF